MAWDPRHQGDGLAGALAIHLFLYCAVGGCFFFGLYELLQPTRFNNLGMAGYNPSPRKVIAYGPSSGVPPDMTVPQPTATDDLASQLTPNVRSAFAHESDGTETIERREPPAGVKKAKYNRKALARVHSTQLETGRARVACIPRYDSSGAQSSSC
jgi:hypothetical protein